MAALQRILFLNQRHHLRRRRRNPRDRVVRLNAAHRLNINPLHLSDDVLCDRYRLSRGEIMTLLGLVQEELTRTTRRNFALSPTIQLLTALRFYATGGFSQTLGDGHRLSKAAVSKCVHAVTKALLRHAPTYITFPQTRDALHETKTGFHAIANIPGVVGAVDGTLIPIHTPSLLSPNYICRKGYSALNVQVVCNHQGLFTDIVAKWPGSTHDSFIWANSGVCQMTEAEERYNMAHSRTRSIVERALGIRKMRFQCLHKSSGGLRCSPERSCAIIAVCAMLHNIAVHAGISLPDEEDEEVEEREVNIPVPAELPGETRGLYQAGLETRRQIINNVFV
ncbi:putative nuclease HARBI1 [Trichomycterus rosablanca]|uniref:putative nuclease HARBI1 n=1 Tax=Trichomycterus rosablanca TaxID=2290929 RepID=UPI002F35ACA9